MAYTGAWRRATRYVDRAAPRHTPDPDHLVPGGLDPRDARDQDQPHRTGAAPRAVEDPESSWALAGGPGGPVDLTPAGHEKDGDHQQDTGTVRARRYEGRSIRRADETYTSEARPGYVGYAGSRAALTVQSDGLPEHNPFGIRPGHRWFRWFDRKIPTRTRRHDLRPIRPRLAAAAVDSAAEYESHTTSPYGTLTPSRRRTAMRPMQRRTPQPWDQDTITDGVTDNPDPGPGMWAGF